MQVGAPVEVGTTFTGSWSSGFEIAEVVAEGYRLRRLSDGAVLPEATPEADLRPATVHRSPWN